MSSIEDDDIPCLSAETFAVLQEFYREQEERESKQNMCEEEIFNENWQLSQFWYDEETIETLIKITLQTVGSSSAKIALVSCPSLYKKLKKSIGDQCEVTLFEYDKRFAAYGSDFIFYDYKSPLSIPREKSGYYDLVLADPPFLSEECLTKTAVTIRYLSKDKILLCTGDVMADLAEKLLHLKKTSFVPKHRNNLANEFSCFSNFDLGNFK